MKYEQDLETALQEIMTRWDIPGLAVGIVEGDEIVYARGLGVQSLESDVPVTLDSIFCVLSVSKCFVATAILQLVEGGILDLDAPLVQYLPYFRMDDERYLRITICQALSHTSGMPDIDESEYIEWMAQPEVDDGAAERFVRSLEDKHLIANPGESFSYSNIAYNVLGDLLAKVSNDSFENAMREQLLSPSGMSNSTFLLAEVPANRLVWPHLRSPEMRVNASYPYHRADAPSSFLHTTIMDMCHWGMISLKRGSRLGRRILSAEGYDLMWSPVAKRGNPPSIYEEMGLGWTLGHYRGLRTVSHGGAGFGSTAFLLLLPEKNGVAVVLCNDESDACNLAARAVADALIGQKPQTSKVSWMVPISRALARGGIAAAYSRYRELDAEVYDLDPYDLNSLALQLQMAKEVELAIEVLGLTTDVYPQHVHSYVQMGRLYLLKGENALARETLLKALSIEPTDATAAGLLKRLH